MSCRGRWLGAQPRHLLGKGSIAVTHGPTRPSAAPSGSPARPRARHPQSRPWWLVYVLRTSPAELSTCSPPPRGHGQVLIQQRTPVLQGVVTPGGQRRWGAPSSHRCDSQV